MSGPWKPRMFWCLRKSEFHPVDHAPRFGEFAIAHGLTMLYSFLILSPISYNILHIYICIYIYIYAQRMWLFLSIQDCSKQCWKTLAIRSDLGFRVSSFRVSGFRVYGFRVLGCGVLVFGVLREFSFAWLSKCQKQWACARFWTYDRTNFWQVLWLQAKPRRLPYI